MTNKELKGLVILMNNQKQLIQTKRIRIYQREKLVDKLTFLIPMDYEWINVQDSGFNMESFTVMMNYLDSSGTVRLELLERYGHYDAEGHFIGYEDYQKDENSEPSHMIYRIPIDSKLTDLAGDYSISLKLQYVDYSAQTENPDTMPEPQLYQMTTDSAILTVMPVVDYYQILPSDSITMLMEQINALKDRAQELEDRADVQEDGLEETNAKMVDDIVLGDDKLYLKNSLDEQVGVEINLNDLGDSLAEYTSEGLIKVITSDDEDPIPDIPDELEEPDEPNIPDEPIEPDAPVDPDVPIDPNNTDLTD